MKISLLVTGLHFDIDLFCQQLYKDYKTNPEDVEFYLPQLWFLKFLSFFFFFLKKGRTDCWFDSNMLLQNINFLELKEFILSQCRHSFHFALKV